MNRARALTTSTVVGSVVLIPLTNLTVFACVQIALFLCVVAPAIWSRKSSRRDAALAVLTLMLTRERKR